MEEFLSNLGEQITDIGLRILISLLLLGVGLKLIRTLGKLFEKEKVIARLDPGVRTFLRSLTRILALFLLFFTILGTLGVPTTSFVTLLGSAGVTVGLALQGGLSNLAGGLILLIMKPFRVGDFITTTTASGTVKSIDIFYTKVLTPDNRTVILPNGSLTNSVVTDSNRHGARRCDLAVSVDAGVDLEMVRGALRQAADLCPLTAKDPEPQAFLSVQTAAAMDLTLRFWCKREDMLAATADLRDHITRLLKEQGAAVRFAAMDALIEK